MKTHIPRFRQVNLIFELVTYVTPLAVAAEHGHVEVVKSLLAARPGTKLNGKRYHCILIVDG